MQLNAYPKTVIIKNDVKNPVLYHTIGFLQNLFFKIVKYIRQRVFHYPFIKISVPRALHDLVVKQKE